MPGKKVPRPMDVYVGLRIRMRRQMLELSQSNVADKLGLTFQQVQKYEKGTNRVGASRLQELSNILEVPPSFFFEGGPGVTVKYNAGTTPEYVTEFMSTPDGMAVAQALTKVKNPKVRRQLVKAVVTMVEHL